jgi:hypothetical protein
MLNYHHETQSNICTEPQLNEALGYLLKSEQDFQTLEMYDSLGSVRYLLSVVYHNLGMGKERDEMSRRHSVGQEKDVDPFYVDPEVQNIFTIIDMVGAVLAAR